MLAVKNCCKLFEILTARIYFPFLWPILKYCDVTKNGIAAQAFADQVI